MDRFEKILIVFIFILFLSISYAVIETARGEMEEVIEKETERRHLPTQCAVYYNDGTDNWKECMGVGYKQ